MTNKLKDNYEIRLRCATCGCEDHVMFKDEQLRAECNIAVCKEKKMIETKYYNNAKQILKKACSVSFVCFVSFLQSKQKN